MKGLLDAWRGRHPQVEHRCSKWYCSGSNLICKHSTNLAITKTFQLSPLEYLFLGTYLQFYHGNQWKKIRLVLHKLLSQPHFWKHICSIKRKSLTYGANLLYAMWMILFLLHLMNFPIIYLPVGCRHQQFHIMAPNLVSFLYCDILGRTSCCTAIYGIPCQQR